MGRGAVIGIVIILVAIAITGYFLLTNNPSESGENKATLPIIDCGELSVSELEGINKVKTATAYFAAYPESKQKHKCISDKLVNCEKAKIVLKGANNIDSVFSIEDSFGEECTIKYKILGGALAGKEIECTQTKASLAAFKQQLASKSGEDGGELTGYTTAVGMAFQVTFLKPGQHNECKVSKI